MLANGFDTDLSKGRKVPESQAAWDRSKLSAEGDCYECLSWLEHVNLTGKEIAKAMDKEFHAVSGRLTFLKVSGLAEVTGTRRDGCAELRITAKGRDALAAHSQRDLFA